MIILSFFRNSERNGQVRRYMQQLHNELGRGYIDRIIAVWGDCVDRTRDALLQEATYYNLPITLVECNHGGPVWGSVENANRFRALSRIGNAGLEQVPDQYGGYVLYVESDIMWTAPTVHSLRQHLASNHADVVAPLIMMGDKFYDTYLFRKDGKRFTNDRPYHPHLSKGLTQMDSVGSMFVARAEVTRVCRMREHALLDFMADARARGYRVACDGSLTARHPQIHWRGVLQS